MSYLFLFSHIRLSNISSTRPSDFIFPDLGAAYGTAKSGVGIMTMGVLEPKLIIKSVIPVVMAGEFFLFQAHLSNMSFFVSDSLFQVLLVCTV